MTQGMLAVELMQAGPEHGLGRLLYHQVADGLCSPEHYQFINEHINIDIKINI